MLLKGKLVHIPKSTPEGNTVYRNKDCIEACFNISCEKTAPYEVDYICPLFILTSYVSILMLSVFLKESY